MIKFGNEYGNKPKAAARIKNTLNHFFFIFSVKDITFNLIHLLKAYSPYLCFFILSIYGVENCIMV